LRGGSLEAVCAVFGVRPTGQREEIPESDIVAAALPSGWRLVVINGNVIPERILEELSRQGEVVYCFVEDHVMFSCASRWSSGNEVWRVAHDGCEKGMFHLEVKGQPPARLETIRRKMLDRQEADGGAKSDVDHIYEVPVELAKELTGFRHDEDVPGANGAMYEVLEPVKDARRKMPVGNLFRDFFKGMFR